MLHYFYSIQSSLYNAQPFHIINALEEREGAGSLVVAGGRFKVIGEEVVPGRPLPPEAFVPISEGFVLYQARRSGGDVPCSFILPPLGLPELESRAIELGIRDVVSVSPSVIVDEYVRGVFGFPPTNKLATVLIGFNKVTLVT